MLICCRNYGSHRNRLFEMVVLNLSASNIILIILL